MSTLDQLTTLYPPPPGFLGYALGEDHPPVPPKWVAVHNAAGADAPTLGEVPAGLSGSAAARYIPPDAAWPLWVQDAGPIVSGAGRHGERAREAVDAGYNAGPEEAGILYRSGEGIVAIFVVTDTAFEDGDYGWQSPLSLEKLPRPVSHARLRSVIRPVKRLPKDLRGWGTPHLANLQRTCALFTSERSWREVMTLVVGENPDWRPSPGWAQAVLDRAYE